MDAQTRNPIALGLHSWYGLVHKVLSSFLAVTNLRGDICPTGFSNARARTVDTPQSTAARTCYIEARQFKRGPLARPQHAFAREAREERDARRKQLAKFQDRGNQIGRKSVLVQKTGGTVTIRQSLRFFVIPN
jgi:hypothetical protein